MLDHVTRHNFKALEWAASTDQLCVLSCRDSEQDIEVPVLCMLRTETTIADDGSETTEEVYFPLGILLSSCIYETLDRVELPDHLLARWGWPDMKRAKAEADARYEMEEG